MRLVALALLTPLALPAAAHAQTTPPDVPPPPWASPAAPRATPSSTTVAPQAAAAERLRRLDAVLTWHEQNQRSQRLAVTIAGGAVGAVGLGLGFVLAGRDTAEDQVAGLFSGAIGAGMLLGIGIGALLPGPWDRVLAPLREGQARRDPAEQVFARTEAAWREAAERNRRGRRWGSVVLLGFGGASLVGGSVLLLVEPRRRSDRESDRALGVTLLGLGSVMGVVGAALLFTPDPVEQSWEVYQRASPSLSLGVAPMPGGAAAAVSGSF